MSLTKELTIATCLVLSSYTASSFSQEVIEHSGTGWAEDGDPARDADGTLNGVIVWKGGARHVVKSTMEFWNSAFPDDSYKLKIEPGAIVEFVGERGLSGGDNLNTVLEIEGATLKSVPDPNRSNNVFPFELTGWGGENPAGEHSFIRNSTLERCGEISPVGWMEIRENKFTEMGRFVLWAVTPETADRLADATPHIVDNEFQQQEQFRGPLIFMNGATGRIIGNTFKTSISATGGSHHAIQLGYMRSSVTEEVYPKDGMTLIRGGNTFIGGGIDMFNIFSSAGGSFSDTLRHATLDAHPLSVEISENNFDGEEVRTGTALTALWEIPIFSDITISRNNILNYGRAIVLHSRAESPGETRVRIPSTRFRINNNQFKSNKGSSKFDGIDFDVRVAGQAPDAFVDQFVAENTFVNAENNDWGHPTGPSDLSNRDGMTNAGGGLEVHDGIDYLPFVGEAPPGDIEQKLSVRPASDPPFTPNSMVRFTPEVTYTLPSGSGDLELEIRTDQGELLIHPRPKLRIEAAENETVSFGELELTIPENANKLIFQTIFFGDASAGAYSDDVSFDVQFVTSQISILNYEVFAKDENGNDVQVTELIPGSEAFANIEVRYTFTPSDPPPDEGTIEILPKQRVRSTPRLFLKTFPSLQATVTGGENKTEAFNNIQFQVPLNNFDVDPTEIVFDAKLTTDAGIEVRTEKTTPIDRVANKLSIDVWVILDLVNGRPIPSTRKLFISGEFYRFGARVISTVKTPNVDNWFIEPVVVFFDENDSEVDRFVGPFVDEDGNPVTWVVSTGNQQETTISFDNVRPVPIAAKAEVFFYLETETGLRVFREQLPIQVREPMQSNRKPVPAGDSIVDLNPIPVSVNLQNNQQEGTLVAHEFEGPFEAPLTQAPSSARAKSTNEEFVQLNRFWDFFTDLEAGTFSADITFTYSPDDDFPANTTIAEDSLVIAVVDTLNFELAELPTQQDTANNSLTASITDFNQIFVLGMLRDIAVSVEPIDDNVPAEYQLLQNYPNPFNPETMIRYQLPRRTLVKLEIFNLLGQKVRTLVDAEKYSGSHTVAWDGRDDRGKVVSAGMYLYRLKTEQFAQSRKLLLLR